MAVEEDATLGRIGGFRLIKRLATGGTSDVLLARAEGPHGFERTVVLKRLLSEHRHDPDFARMFAREAAAYARLSHPAIVRLFDFFTSDGQLVMVLEYIDGVSLARLMTHAAQNNIKLDDRVCFFLAARIFDALAAAHDARNPDTSEPTPVIHRDVNPSNVLIPWDGHAKLADFGIAKITGADAEGVETTQGLIKGTYGYMAPEQVKGERVTIRTDVYAATLVLWELLARRKAIQADRLPEMEILRAMAEPNLPALDILRPDVHESIREAIGRGLEPNASKRAITSEEMVGILRAHFDPEDARQRLSGVLLPLSPRRSLSDTIAEDMRETREAPSEPFANPAMTLPLAGADKPKPSVPRPITRGFAPQPPTAHTAAAVLAETASALEPLHRQTPSGFRPISVPALDAPALNQPTLAGGFMPAPPPAPTVPAALASDAPTLETRKSNVSNVHEEVTVAAPLMVPPPAAVPPPPPPPVAAPWQSPAPPPVAPVMFAPPMAPMPPPPPPAPASVQGAYPPIVQPARPPRNTGFIVAIALGALVGVVAVISGVAFLVLRGGTSTTETSTTATTTATTKPANATNATNATATAARAATTQASSTSAVATPKPSTTATSATATTSTTPTATATTAAVTSSGMPTPAADEGVLVLPASAQGHRVFIDGRVKGDGSSPIVVKCGPHTVQIGSQGKSRDVDVPCGALAKLE